MLFRNDKKLPNVKKLAQQMVDRLSLVTSEIDKNKAKSEKLKINHNMFWTRLQDECEKNGGHSDGALSYRVSNFYGRTCCYCRARLSNPGSFWSAESHIEHSVTDDFGLWLDQDTSDWPENKQKLYEKGRKEFEKYNSEIKKLDDSREKLEELEAEIYAQLNDIWAICESVLHKTQNKNVASIYGAKVID